MRGRAIPKSSIIRHLKSCQERKRIFNQEKSNETCEYFTLMISDYYNNSLWLVADVKADITFSKLTKVLRTICPGGKIIRGKFAFVPFDVLNGKIIFSLGPYKIPMEKRLSELLTVGDTFYYLGGLLIPMEFKIDVNEKRIDRKRKEKILLEARFDENGKEGSE